VKVDLSWLIIVALLWWTTGSAVFPEWYPGMADWVYVAMGLAAVMGLFLSVVIHELCHSLVARRYGLPMKGITLFVFGGVAEMHHEPPSPKAELLMALGGPAASVVIALCAGAIWLLGERTGWPLSVSGVFGWLGGLNIALAIFNMLPAFPLDGGRVLRSILWSWKKSLRKATYLASRVGAGFGLAVAILGGAMILMGGAIISGIWLILIGMFIRGAAKQGYQQVLIRQMLEGESVRRFMSDDPVTVPAQTQLDDFVENYVYEHHHKMYPVVDRQGNLAGCVTTREIKQTPREHWSQEHVADVARECDQSNTISPDSDAVDAMKQMRQNESSRLMVVRDGKVVGMLALKDLMNFLSMKIELEGDESGEEMPAQAEMLQQEAAARRS
jgi:Zn-dependent protease